MVLWGGAAVVTEALNYVSKTPNANEVADFVAKTRVYSISNQDDASAWIRSRFESLFFVVVLHTFNKYSMSTWGDICGDRHQHFDQGGPDTSPITNDWVIQHVRIGELGAHYPDIAVIMEGSTPSFFHLISNGLGDPEHPEYESWGGRYKLLDVLGRVRAFGDVADRVFGIKCQRNTTRHGTIWRWRKDYQWDLANRMRWTTTTDYSQANHAPVVSIKGTCSPSILTVLYNVSSAGNSFILDASASWDPDHDALQYNWIWYQEVTCRATGNDAVRDGFVSIQKLDAREQWSMSR
jgi:hypothetical protein